MKKSKIIISLIVFVTLFSASLAMVSATHVLKQDNDNKDIDFGEILLMQDIIPKAVYFGADEVDDNEDGLVYYLENKTDLNKNVNSLMRSVSEEFRDLFDEEKDFQYYAYNSITKLDTSNANSDLRLIEKSEKEASKYRWYLIMKFDKEGNLSIQTNDKNEQETLRYQNDLVRKLNRFRKDYMVLEYDEVDPETNEFIELRSYESSLTKIHDMTYIFAISEQYRSGYGFVDQHISYFGRTDIENTLIPICMILSAIVAIIALLIPIRYLHQIKTLQYLSKIKIEFLSVMVCLSSFGLALLGLEFVRMYNAGDFVDLFKSINNEAFTTGAVFFLFSLLWLLFFFLIFFTAYMIKLLFDKGIVRFIKENTFVAWLIHTIMKIVDRVVHFDLRDNSNKALVRIVGLNFLIITGISFFFVFGFFITVIYSVLLFVILQDRFDQIKRDYDVLLKATKKLSNGDFEIEIKEDLGMFNSLRDEFSNIRDGFEKAVNEEVKSQKMKTELVSNVSHDLKTPLTSIITYTDLLKDDTLSEQQRKEYLDTLERNSLRLKNIIEDLFEMSKANSGNVTLNRIDVDIVALIKQAQFECYDQLQQKNLSFNMNFAQEKMIHTLDSSKTYRIFENLFTNIAKYALANTRVYVDVSENEEAIEIIFKNISENALNKEGSDLVERFVQGDDSRNSEGSGLGLAIAKSFSELQNGSLHVAIDGDLFKVIVTFRK